MTAKWKGLTFFVLGTGEFGGHAMKNNESYYWISGEDKYSAVVRGRWTPETAATAKLPRATIDGVKNNYRDSELWVKDASYLRLKNIEIGYNFRLPFMPKIGMEKMRVFMTGYNLLTFDKLKISDPESMSSGVPQYPVMRVINFGLNVSF